ncbi:hypothetical protein AUR04nite_19250 [Glutamicibacter uratoxydans]|uniref:Uncharacterized protein n=1 Tax=Glutamicibacter uratoxydans TaxID=43667 RepID=A0A4Y4DP72_GLUUR|nr:hypothetical protein [Glutamicibacter uratoxydans]GED06393.1 hypothetical protein AUR04nite_19250 [Glutamicibacter uratoxydans]
MASPFSRFRSIAAILCLTIGIVLAPLSITGLWATKNLTDTNGFTALMKPLASNQGLQDDVANMITGSISESLQIEKAIESIPGSSWLPDALSPQHLAEKSDELINRGVSNVIRSEQFASLWEESVRTSHAKTISVLSDQSRSVRLEDGGVLSFQLGSILDEISTPLTQLGIPGIVNMLNIDPHWDLRIIQSDALPAVQTLYNVTTTFGPWMIYVSAALIAAGILLESKFLTSALMVLGIGLGLSALIMNTFLFDYSRGVLFAGLRHEVAESVYYQLVGSLVGVLTTTAVISLILGLASWPISQMLRKRQAMNREFVVESPVRSNH